MLILSFSIFAFVAFAVLGVYFLMFRPVSAATERLGELEQPAPPVQVEHESPVAVFAERIAEPIQRLAPPSASDAHKLQLKLMQAGFRASNAPVVFRAVQMISMLALPGMLALLWLLMGKPLSGLMIPALAAFAVGFLLPRFLLNRMIRNRQLRISWGLADALDLMVISMEAGLGLNAAMVRVSEELKSVHPDICKEFEIANLEIRVGRDRSESLRNLAERTGVEDLSSLVGMLIQADRFGTSIAKAVRIYADSLRTKRRQRAEQEAQKAAFKLLLPLGVFLFPTLFIIILGPALLNIQDLLSR